MKSMYSVLLTFLKLLQITNIKFMLCHEWYETIGVYSSYSLVCLVEKWHNVAKFARLLFLDLFWYFFDNSFSQDIILNYVCYLV